MADFPYTTVPKSVRPFLNHIQGAGIPPKVTQQYLESTGFKSTNDRRLIGILKFIGFIDGSGAPTETWKKFRSKTSGGAVLASALRLGYKTLFETYPDAYQRPNNIIRDFISGHSDAGGRVLDGMVGTFKALCDAADFTAGSPKVEDEASEDQPSELDEEEDVQSKRHKMKRNGGAQIILNLQLVVPATDDPAIYDSFFDAMKRHLMQSDE
jgi:hypothetical protein